ncbi:MAG: class I [Candidatus Tokpelaia sp. JSC161]|jgi:lysyl-tRNA synthetase class 1|nr:MAG: class I [Candidatus Tokpelaia sp. JSC161]
MDELMSQFFDFLSNVQLLELVHDAKAWPFEEARKIVRRYEQRGYPDIVLFQTGYGPSGLPHIGTFGEVLRTSMVRYAFHILTENKVNTRLICFSDDMDGLRKVPDNVPNRDMLLNYIGKPLTRVPNPFSDADSSFGAANNACLRNFLDKFDFDYDFASATDYYTRGDFDEVLLKILICYEKVMSIILPTLGEERRETYSPFLPISPITGKVLQVPILARDSRKGSIVYLEPETGDMIETEVTGGKVKCQWKVDWAMRWAALGIDYEMAGKDLIDSVLLSSKICRILGSRPPEGFNYELFLDEKGRKISKSKGNGLAMDEWLRYAPIESLSLYMYHKPRSAKRLFFDVIPKLVDEYYGLISRYETQTWKERISNPVWHIHKGHPPEYRLPVSFSMLLNLVSASNAENNTVLWGFISRYAEGVTRENCPELDSLVIYAVRYFNEFVRPKKKFRLPDAVERKALIAIYEGLASLEDHKKLDSMIIQNMLLDVGRHIERYQDHKHLTVAGVPSVSVLFFQMIYQVLIGQTTGPRLGSFIALYGIEETKRLITTALDGKLLGKLGYAP